MVPQLKQYTASFVSGKAVTQSLWFDMHYTACLEAMLDHDKDGGIWRSRSEELPCRPVAQWCRRRPQPGESN